MAASHGSHLEGEGESYLASLSDLMVGLLFVFIIILMAFALNYRVAQQSTTEVVQQLTNAEQLRREMLQELERSLKAQGVNVQVDVDNGIVRLPESLLFDSGSADFRPGGLEALDTLAKTLSRVLPCSGVDGTLGRFCNTHGESRLDAVFIEGHTDVYPIKTREFADNWELSATRSRRTWQALSSRSPVLGTLVNRRKQPLFSISAYGATRPVADNSTEEGRQNVLRNLDGQRLLPEKPRLEAVARVLDEQLGPGMEPPLSKSELEPLAERFRAAARTGRYQALARKEWRRAPDVFWFKSGSDPMKALGSLTPPGEQ